MKRKKACSFAVALLLLLGLLAASALTALAETAAIRGRLEISHTCLGEGDRSPAAADGFSYRISPLDGQSPAPSGAGADGSLLVSFTGNDTETRQVYFDFIHAGTYHYRVEPVIRAAYSDYEYDETVYQVDVYVTNEVQEALRCMYLIRADGGEKCGSVSYLNRYRPGTDPKTGDDTLLWPWTLLAFASFAMVCLLLLSGKKGGGRTACSTAADSR